MKVGVIGCGNISSIYFDSVKIYNNFEIIACADIKNEIAQKSADKYNLKAQSVDEIFLNPDIDIILNLTIPTAHKDIITRTLESGKHSFSEKPLAINFDLLVLRPYILVIKQNLCSS